MSDILNQDAILISTVLKPCGNCGHPRAAHQQDKRCNVTGCTCHKFME